MDARGVSVSSPARREFDGKRSTSAYLYEITNARTRLCVHRTTIEIDQILFERDTVEVSPPRDESGRICVTSLETGEPVIYARVGGSGLTIDGVTQTATWASVHVFHEFTPVNPEDAHKIVSNEKLGPHAWFVVHDILEETKRLEISWNRP